MSAPFACFTLVLGLFLFFSLPQDDDGASDAGSLAFEEDFDDADDAPAPAAGPARPAAARSAPAAPAAAAGGDGAARGRGAKGKRK